MVDFIKMFDCICPFVGEEIYHLLGNEELITYAKWPTYDESKLVVNEKEIGVQVNGKLRATIKIKLDETDEEVKNKAISNEKVKQFIGDKEIIKVIYIKNKIVSIVIAK